LRRNGEEVVQRAAFVSLEVRKGQIAQLGRVQHFGDCVAREREHAPRPGVEQQRLVVQHEVLVEAEAATRNLDG
jgi:hypothetical protein